MNAFAKVDKDTFYRFMAERREQRYEYVRGRIVQQMTGGTRDHGRIALVIASLLTEQLDKRSWTVLVERGVETTETIRYADVCVEPADEPGSSLSTRRPALIVEVLSPSTSFDDLDAKPREYLPLNSLAAYVVASQREPALLVWLRAPDGAWPAEPAEIKGREETVVIDGRGLSARLPLAQIYADIASA
jgi:Uma2 family endonuclease